MRKFRNAALAGATAMALTFGGTSVAAAEENTDQTNTQPGANQDATDQETNGQNESEASEKKETEINGREIFGQKPNWDAVPSSWKAIYAGTWILGIVAVIAAIAGPIDNFIKYGPFAK
ncbi:hypothetical protein [Corynebacterium sp. CCUG 70398]|uniref:hypothetical protein n=1 Tax=Corynebacterium sp. CCUG 70398 TaxID=2823891 RepID=UPI00210E33AF|nr:hypothetical protein [Corynebacterium sp. CCUG 70398]MCQ4622847.1 hypothetical protein [Corynebacterium sp. CCUG 70398]